MLRTGDGSGARCLHRFERRSTATRCRADHYPHVIRRARHDRVDGDLLLRGLDDPVVRQPVLEPRPHSGRREIGMLIDWFTVGAQAVNFLILVWLLKRFLYKPVLAAVDAREKKIAAQIAGAAALETKAQAERTDLHQRSEALNREREGLLHKATEEANAERKRLIEADRKESLQLHSKLTQALAQERAELGHQLSVRTQAEVFAVARKTLADLAGPRLEDRMIEVFIAHLR